MNSYLFFKAIHIISSTILFGTGIGIAFFMYRSKFTEDLHQKLYLAKSTVIADYIFTLPAVIMQFITGAWLVWKSGYDWMGSWLIATYIIYAIAGLCWLPVVWIQIKLKDIIQRCVADKSELPEQYHRLFKVWCILGWPAFLGLVVVFFLMVAKPI